MELKKDRSPQTQSDIYEILVILHVSSPFKDTL